jgi:hypothetical protein
LLCPIGCFVLLFVAVCCFLLMMMIRFIFVVFRVGTLTFGLR